MYVKDLDFIDVKSALGDKRGVIMYAKNETDLIPQVRVDKDNCCATLRSGVSAGIWYLPW